MNGKRKATSKMVSQNDGGKESKNESNGKKRARSRGRKRSRTIWAIEVSNVKATTQVMNEMERFFIKRVCPWEKKLLSKGFTNGQEHRDPSLGVSQKGEKSFFFEFLNQSQQQAALKLDGLRFGKGLIQIRRWVKESAENSAFETPNEDSQPPSPGVPDSIELPARQLHSDTLLQRDNVISESQSDINNLSRQQLEDEIKAKDRLLAASNEHIETLTEMNSKYEKRIAGQLDQIEGLKARLQSQQKDSKDAELGPAQREITPQEQQDEFINNQAKRIGDLEAELKIQQLHNVAKDEKLRQLETALARKGDELAANQERQQKKIANQRLEIAKLQAKLGKSDRKEKTTAPTVHQHEQPPELAENRLGSARDSQGPAINECLRSEPYTTTLISNIEALKGDLMDTIVLKDFAVEEKKMLQKQLENITREKQTLQNRLNYSIKENDSIRTNFLAKEQAIKQSIEIVETELKSLRSENQNLANKIQERNDLELAAEQSASNLKETIEKLVMGGVASDDKDKPHDNDILRQQLDTEIEAKQRLLAAANAHIEVLTERSGKYEKRLWDQTSQIEDLKARLPNPQVEKEKASSDAAVRVPKGHQDERLATIRTLEAKVDILETEAFGLKADVAAKTEKIGNQRMQLANLAKKVKNLETEIAAKEEKIGNQRSQLGNLGRKLKKHNPTDAIANIHKLAAEIGRHEATIANQKRRIAEYQAKLNKRDAKDITQNSQHHKRPSQGAKHNADVTIIETTNGNDEALKKGNQTETTTLKGEGHGPSQNDGEDKLEAKLIMALQDQNKLLEENRQLRRDKESLQRTISRLEACVEENEQLQEEIEQMRMSRAMEMGFMEGSST